MCRLSIHSSRQGLGVSGIIKMSRNDIEPSSLVSSTVNLMAVSTELMCVRILINLLVIVSHISSTYLSHIKKLPQWDMMGDPIDAPCTCS